ncbi:MAG: Alpha-ketoglutarate-dependent taurine dioxygenase [Chlamydiae bacterium]|nr:Alpha-ketoglutarate-dependent taurine dioxygenase [Chlamydiota bacterium]
MNLIGRSSASLMCSATTIFQKKKFCPNGLNKFISNIGQKTLSKSLPPLTRISPALGAEVTTIDLSRPQDQAIRDLIQRGLDEFSALIFRNQSLCGQQMVESLRFLGHVAIEQHYVDQGLTLDGCPECFVLKNDEHNPPLFDFWHTDKTGWKNPVLYTVLLCKETPEMGGDTCISNNRKAFSSMSEGMKKILREMVGVYNERNAFVHNSKVAQYLKNKGFDPTDIYDQFQDQFHPIIRRNPRNGMESIYFSPPYFSNSVV